MKIALVTGGSRGIGRAICTKLAFMRFHVIINYHNNENEALVTLENVNKSGGSGELLKFDVGNSVEVENALENWQKTNPDKYIQVLVNNAGIRKDALIIWMDNNSWNDVINTNLNGFFYTTRFLIKNMIVNKFGRIINIVSLSGLKGLPGQVNYSAAKGAVIAATKALAQEVGKKKITVNAIAPGFISTDMTADLDQQQLKAMIPLNRFGTPEEVAELAGFLASENSSYITGEVISINGGLYS